MIILDCMGEICPVPIIRLQNIIHHIKEGESIQLITDHSCTLSSVSDFCRIHHLEIDPEEVMTGVWEILISKKE